MFLFRFFEKLFSIKYVVIAFLITTNIALYFGIQSQKTQWHGEVEIPDYTWLFYTCQLSNQLNHHVTYVDVTQPDLETVSFDRQYPFSPIGNNKYLLINQDMPVKVHQQTAYALDDECHLIFRGPHLFQINNFVLSCRED